MLHLLLPHLYGCYSSDPLLQLRIFGCYSLPFNCHTTHCRCHRSCPLLPRHNLVARDGLSIATVDVVVARSRLPIATQIIVVAIIVVSIATRNTWLL